MLHSLEFTRIMRLQYMVSFYRSNQIDMVEQKVHAKLNCRRYLSGMIVREFIPHLYNVCEVHLAWYTLLYSLWKYFRLASCTCLFIYGKQPVLLISEILKMKKKKTDVISNIEKGRVVVVAIQKISTWQCNV